MIALGLVVRILLVMQSKAKHLSKNESIIQTLRGALGDNMPA